jgi:hypothetical protein
VYEVVVNPRSCGIIHVKESGTTNIGINSAPHVSSIDGLCYLLFMLIVSVTNAKHTQTFVVHSQRILRGFYLRQYFRKEFRVFYYVVFSFLVTQFPCLPCSYAELLSLVLIRLSPGVFFPLELEVFPVKGRPTLMDVSSFPLFLLSAKQHKLSG